MKTLKDKSTVPPRGYSYTQKETGHTIQANSLNQLFTYVIEHRKANNLPVPFNIQEHIETSFCEERPELCKDSETKPANIKKNISFNDALRFTKTLVSAGLKRCGQAEADQRAAICLMCEDNINPVGCSSCKRGIVKKAVSFIVGNKETPYDSSLKSCKHCGCFNAAQVWIPLDALRKTISKEENDALPSHCWKKI